MASHTLGGNICKIYKQRRTYIHNVQRSPKMNNEITSNTKNVGRKLKQKLCEERYTNGQ